MQTIVSHEDSFVFPLIMVSWRNLSSFEEVIRAGTGLRGIFLLTPFLIDIPPKIGVGNLFDKKKISQ